jgi:putative ABC transport system permease protein
LYDFEFDHGTKAKEMYSIPKFADAEYLTTYGLPLAAIAIFLGCRGLYGLASFMAIQRTKEVGIRKVLGASIQNIVYLFTREFAVLIAIAFLIAAPIAWYFMHRWLQDYAFRLPITWWIFLAGGAASLTVALVTISFNAIKAARANPVKSLRTE